MRVIILGAGNAGRNLAAKLCAEKHDVVVVDHEAKPLAELSNQYDVLAIQGWASSPRVLEQANVKSADLVVAVTSQDEVNLLACRYAQAAGVPFKVARVANEDYFDEGVGLSPRDMGVDLAINPRKACAAELASILTLSGTQEVVSLVDDRVMAIGFKVSTESPLLRAPLRDFPQPDLLRHVRFVAYRRGEELAIPHGETWMQVGDDVYVVGEPEVIEPFLRAVYPDKPDIRKVVIAGGGGLGLSLARQLDRTDLKIVLIEKDEQQAAHCSERLNKTLVLQGDVMSGDILDHAGINDQTAFVAATRDDENNIISCLLAQKSGASFTIAQVSRPEYVPVINNLSLLDRAVSPHLSMINSILHFVRGKNVKSASLLHTLPGELLEVVLSAESPWAHRAVKDLRIPKGAIIATVLREGKVEAPTGVLELQPGDRVVLFSLPEAVARLRKLCCGD